MESTNRSHPITSLQNAHDSQHDSQKSICTPLVQPIAFGVSLNLNLQSQSHWSLFNGTWQKRPGELDQRLRFDWDLRLKKWHSKCNRLYLRGGGNALKQYPPPADTNDVQTLHLESWKPCPAGDRSTNCRNYRSLLQKSPIKESTFCERDL